MKSIDKQIRKSITYIRKYYKKRADIGLILGSGLGVIADSFEDPICIPYDKIPFFPSSTVVGHSNTLVLGRLYNLNVVVMKGRFHYYEGYSMDQLTYPVRIMKELGVRKMIVTNACGGVDKKFKVGDLMVITDHINLMGANPLRGWCREDIAPRFIDMTFAYSPELIKVMQKVAVKNKIKLQKGVYAAEMGPSYETPAEIEMARRIGASAVGMSTVPEVIVANQMGMEVCGISLITNMAAGILKKRLDHKEVIEASEKARDKFVKLVKNFVKELS